MENAARAATMSVHTIAYGRPAGLTGPKENDWAVTAELPLAAAEDGIAR